LELRKGKSIDWSKKVEVYRNLRNGQLSIRQNGIVVAYTDYAYLNDVEFVVRKAGLKKVRESGQKNVHAFAKGYLCKAEPGIFHYNKCVTYNPFKYDSFVIKKNDKPIFTAKQILVKNNGEIWAF
jgi:hypothetical protein